MISKGSKVKVKATGEMGSVAKVLDGGFQVKVRKTVLDRKTGKPVVNYRGGGYRVRIEAIEVTANEIELVRECLDGSAHSQKGLETLKQMAVDPETVGHVHVIYVKEQRPVTKHWQCAVCDGRGFAPMPLKDAKGRAEPTPEQAAKLRHVGGYVKVYDAKCKAVGDCWQIPEAKRKLVRCPRECELREVVAIRRNRVFRETEYQVYETRDVIFTVGYPQWSKGVRHDSRFNEVRSEHYQCELCAKAIPSGRRCPIEGKDAKGKPHGLMVGEDCAKKFTGTVFQGEKVDRNQEIIMEREFKAGLKAKGVDVK